VPGIASRHARRWVAAPPRQLGKNILQDLADPAPYDSHGRVPRDNRRLADKLLLAFHQACDQQEDLVALQLLSILEPLFARLPRQAEFKRRLSLETLVAAHERLWHIRHAVGLAVSGLSEQSSSREQVTHRVTDQLRQATDQTVE
jgi:hypothetical protein